MMKITLACSALTLLFAAPAAAQTSPLGTGNQGSPGPFTRPPASSKIASPKAKDPSVLRSGDTVPEPTALDEVKTPVIPQPAEPIDEYLLQKEHGPFMVSAYSFTGPEAAKYAQILAMEIRRDYNLPAYVWLAKIQPMKSNVYGVQPTAPAHSRNNDLSPPERWRTQDEAAVLVGNCKTIAESKAVWKQVKHIYPKCLDTFPVIYQNRKGKGLNRAMMTTNPFAPSQNLYPGGAVGPTGLPLKQGQAFDPSVAAASFEQARKVDPLVKRMNTGPNVITKNPSKYTLQVAEYTGRAAIEVNKYSGDAYLERNPENRTALKQSPLMTAHADAERLADVLNKCKSMTGMRAYVFHTRTRSIVTIGGFNSPTDPNYLRMMDTKTGQNTVGKISQELITRGFSMLPLQPASELMKVPTLD